MGKVYKTRERGIRNKISVQSIKYKGSFSRNRGHTKEKEKTNLNGYQTPKKQKKKPERFLNNLNP